MKNVVIYHRADFDGIFCREIAKKFLPDAELLGWDYGDPTPDVTGMFGMDITLYILDLSVPDLMTHPKLIWIDHHKSAIETYPATIKGYRIDGVAACRLAWQWFLAWKANGRDERGEWNGAIPGKSQFIEREVSEPEAVRLAGEYDIWDKRDPNAELFQHGLRSRDLTDEIWKSLFSDNGVFTISHLLESGKAIQYASTKSNESIIKEIGFDLDFEGLKFLACNHARYNSHLFTAGLRPDHDACFGFKWTGKEWSISLYHAPGKEHHDLSLIAKKYGGGGHRGACGFRIKDNPALGMKQPD